MDKLIFPNIFNTNRLTVKELKEKLLSFNKDRVITIASDDFSYKKELTGESFVYRGNYSALALSVKSVVNEKEDKTVEETLKIVDNMINKFKDEYQFEYTDIYISVDESLGYQCFIADVVEINGMIYIIPSYH